MTLLHDAGPSNVARNQIVIFESSQKHKLIKCELAANVFFIVFGLYSLGGYTVYGLSAAGCCTLFLFSFNCQISNRYFRISEEFTPADNFRGWQFIDFGFVRFWLRSFFVFCFLYFLGELGAGAANRCWQTTTEPNQTVWTLAADWGASVSRFPGRRQSIEVSLKMLQMLLSGWQHVAGPNVASRLEAANEWKPSRQAAHHGSLPVPLSWAWTWLAALAIHKRRPTPFMTQLNSSGTAQPAAWLSFIFIFCLPAILSVFFRVLCVTFQVTQQRCDVASSRPTRFVFGQILAHSQRLMSAPSQFRHNSRAADQSWRWRCSWSWPFPRARFWGHLTVQISPVLAPIQHVN